MLKTLSNNIKNKYFANTFSFALGITLISSCLFGLSFYFHQIDTLFAYQRHYIINGDVWQLITGNLLHTNHWHLLMNLAGLWVILSLFDMHFNKLGLWLLMLVLCLLEGLGLFYFYPSLMAYVGLSGVLHGFFAYGAIADIRKGIRFGWLLMLGVIAKVGYEQINGASADVTALIEAPVATESHLVGAVAGTLLGLFALLLSKHSTSH